MFRLGANTVYTSHPVHHSFHRGQPSPHEELSANVRLHSPKVDGKMQESKWTCTAANVNADWNNWFLKEKGMPHYFNLALMANLFMLQLLESNFAMLLFFCFISEVRPKVYEAIHIFVSFSLGKSRASFGISPCTVWVSDSRGYHILFGQNGNPVLIATDKPWTTFEDGDQKITTPVGWVQCKQGDVA